jgi:t-SNARE complex subunit (syntaxin)
MGYSNARAQEIRNIEATIHQLGTIFSQLALLVAEQGEQVQRYGESHTGSSTWAGTASCRAEVTCTER